MYLPIDCLPISIHPIPPIFRSTLGAIRECATGRRTGTMLASTTDFTRCNPLSDHLQRGDYVYPSVQERFTHEALSRVGYHLCFLPCSMTYPQTSEAILRALQPGLLMVLSLRGWSSLAKTIVSSSDEVRRLIVHQNARGEQTGQTRVTEYVCSLTTSMTTVFQLRMRIQNLNLCPSGP